MAQKHFKLVVASCRAAFSGNTSLPHFLVYTLSTSKAAYCFYGRPSVHTITENNRSEITVAWWEYVMVGVDVVRF